MSGQRILDVGQCDLDHGNIGGLLRRQFSAEVERAHTVAEALQALSARSFDLVLVNRIFDQTGESGLDFIRTVKSEPATSTTPIVLVSNYPDAQAEAVEAGALPGFGKASLADPATLTRLQQHLSQTTR